MAKRNVKKIVLKGVSVSHNHLHVYYYLQSIPAMPLCWGFKVLHHDITCSSNNHRNKFKFTHITIVNLYAETFEFAIDQPSMLP